MNPADTTLANILLAVLARIDALDGAMQAQAAQLQLLIDQQRESAFCAKRPTSTVADCRTSRQRLAQPEHWL